ncbi:tyrosine phosphatase family-domain-containing protein [Cladochytrium replicatum]|nr:tyrosine phosphatase family-domain-containing protein [Cladochytrium replicatum]
MSTVTLLVPPDAFGIVEKGIYRSNALQPANFGYIRTLNLKSVLVLSTEVPTRQVISFFEDQKIAMTYLGHLVNAWKPILGWRPISEELIKEGLQFILNAQHHPVLVMCTSGIHETGMLVGCLRKLQHYSFNSIIMEYRSYAGTKSRLANEQFIELFDLDLITLPQTLPSWFLDYMRLKVVFNQHVLNVIESEKFQDQKIHSGEDEEATPTLS